MEQIFNKNIFDNNDSNSGLVERYKLITSQKAVNMTENKNIMIKILDSLLKKRGIGKAGLLANENLKNNKNEDNDDEKSHNLTTHFTSNTAAE